MWCRSARTSGSSSTAVMDRSGTGSWGATLGAVRYTARSGIGIDAAGDLLYSGGPGLDAQSLAHVLIQAGAVRAMELDINPQWVSFSYYTSPGSGTDLLAKYALRPEPLAFRQCPGLHRHLRPIRVSPSRPRQPRHTVSYRWGKHQMGAGARRRNVGRIMWMTLGRRSFVLWRTNGAAASQQNGRRRMPAAVEGSMELDQVVAFGPLDRGERAGGLGRVEVPPCRETRLLPGPLEE